MGRAIPPESGEGVGGFDSEATDVGDNGGGSGGGSDGTNTPPSLDPLRAWLWVARLSRSPSGLLVIGAEGSSTGRG